MHYKKRHLILLIIILLASTLRLLWLDRIPAAINGDELTYPITAKSVYLTGKDLSGTWSIYDALRFRYPPNQQQAELPYFLHFIVSGAMPFSLFNAHLPYALMGIGVTILLYAISTSLFGPTIGYITGFVAAVNPWSVTMSRTGYESTPATFFYLLGVYILIKTKKWELLWSIIPFILAFYSYIATKVLFIPFVSLSVLLAYRHNNKKYLTQYGIILLSTILFSIFFIIALKTSPTSTRISDIFLPSNPVVISMVNEGRKNTITSPLSSLMINKYTEYIHILGSKLLRILSPSYLFSEGDLFFPLHSLSFFYKLDFIFLFLFLLTIFGKNRYILATVILYILIGALPQLLHRSQDDFSIHLTMMFPVIICCIALGIYEFIVLFPKRYKFIIGGFISILYIFNTLNLFLLTIYRAPYEDLGVFSMRVLSRYINLVKHKNLPITVYGSTNEDHIYKYLFYTNSLSKNTIYSLIHPDSKDSFNLENVNFLSCNSGIHANKINNTMIFEEGCSPPQLNSYLSISRLKDGGQLYKIVNDVVCHGYSLKQYPAELTIHQLAVETINEQSFCETYISKY